MEGEIDLGVQTLMRLENQIRQRIAFFYEAFPEILEQDLQSEEPLFLRAFAAIATEDYVEEKEKVEGNKIDINDLAEEISLYLDVIDIVAHTAYEYGLTVGFFKGIHNKLTGALTTTVNETPEETHHAG